MDSFLGCVKGTKEPIKDIPFLCYKFCISRVSFDSFLEFLSTAKIVTYMTLNFQILHQSL